MENQSLDIITIGESLIELSSDTNLSNTKCLYKYYGGDSLVSAVAASRLGAKVGFITRVGNDPFKDYLMDSWVSEGLDISQVKISNEPNGFYFITRPSVQEKEIIYYRKKVAQSKISIDDINEDYISCAKIVYTTGTTQSISLSSGEAVLKAYEFAKKHGVFTAYDPNYSSFVHTPETAKENFHKVITNVDILFISTKHDTGSILELDSIENIIRNIWDMGVNIVVLKSSEKGGYYTGVNGNIEFCEFYTKEVVDTTCSGDAFNGAFMYGITHGYTPNEATNLASVVAGLQAKGIGAIKSVPYAGEVFSIFKRGS
jgi:2-dehydro-3-deoxygluconokinase